MPAYLALEQSGDKVTGLAGGSGKMVFGPVSGARALTKFTPVLLMQLNSVFLRSDLNAFPGGVAFRVAHPLHLLEAGGRVAHVSGVVNGFFAFLGESEIVIGEVIAAGFSDLGHAYR